METAEEKTARLEAAYERKALEQQHARIEREGFEVGAWDVAANEGCRNRVWRKRRGRYGHEYCGRQAVVKLQFAGPSNPEGVREPFCKECIGSIIKDLLGHLTID